MNENAFELAIFRVYDRTMENLRDDDVPHEGSMSLKTCRLFEKILIGMALFFALVLSSLHLGIVGRAGCLPALLEEQRVFANRSSVFPTDAILQINVDPRYYDNQIDLTDDDIDDDVFGDERRRALRSTTMEYGSYDSRYGGGYREEREMLDDGVTNTLAGWLQLRRRQLSSSPSNDGDAYSNRRERDPQQGRFSHFNLQRTGQALPYKSMASSMAYTLYSALASIGEPLIETLGGRGPSYIEERDAGMGSAPSRYLLSTNTSTSTTSSNNTRNSTESGPRYDPKYFKSYDYEFAHDLGVLSLSNTLRAKHNFTLVNISVYGDQCFGNSLLQAFLPLGGVDMLVMNNVMYSLPSKGGMLISSRNDFYIWKKEDLHPYHNPGTWLGYKIIIVMKILFSFAILSTTTAVLVRILISSGVVLLFPIFSLLFNMGITNSDQHIRIISQAYPWLGIPMEIFRERTQSFTPFVVGHLGRVVVYYVLYEALQFAMSVWLYDTGAPGNKELWLFASMMVWEYFSMIYVRSTGSILLFPRAAFLLFALYHVYLFSFPAGFHLLAIFVMFLLVGILMLYCIRTFEYEAYQRGAVSMDCTRQYYNSLPWPIWTHGLPPDYTLFMPVQFRSTSIYMNPVTPLHGGGSGDGSGGSDGDTTTGDGDGDGDGSNNDGDTEGVDVVVSPAHSSESGEGTNGASSIEMTEGGGMSTASGAGQEGQGGASGGGVLDWLGYSQLMNDASAHSTANSSSHRGQEGAGNA